MLQIQYLLFFSRDYECLNCSFYRYLERNTHYNEVEPFKKRILSCDKNDFSTYHWKYLEFKTFIFWLRFVSGIGDSRVIAQMEKCLVPRWHLIIFACYEIWRRKKHNFSPLKTGDQSLFNGHVCLRGPKICGPSRQFFVNPIFILILFQMCWSKVPK